MNRVAHIELELSEVKVLCKRKEFWTVAGGIYLEKHHVIPLSENGIDRKSNVVALCPNDHRKARHGEHRAAIRQRLLAVLAETYKRRSEM